MWWFRRKVTEAGRLLLAAFTTGTFEAKLAVESFGTRLDKLLLSRPEGVMAMDEKLVRKALGALEGQVRQRTAVIEVLVRHLTDDTPSCQETINRLFDVLDVPQAAAENEQAEQTQEELETALDQPVDRGRKTLHVASYH